jgi:hypothetical protein
VHLNHLDQFKGTSEGELAAWLRQILANHLAQELRKFTRPGHNVALERSLQAAVEKSSVILGDQEAVAPQVLLRARAIGAMRMRDEKGQDDKIIAVHIDDPEYESYHDIYALAPHRLRELQRFFLDYKVLEGKQVLIEAFLGPAEAAAVLQDAIALYARQEPVLRQSK